MSFGSFEDLFAMVVKQIAAWLLNDSYVGEVNPPVSPLGLCLGSVQMAITRSQEAAVWITDGVAMGISVKIVTFPSISAR